MLAALVLATSVVCVGAMRPNIVFILADDLGYNDIGYHARLHNSDMRTPHLDEMASQGVNLENYYVQPLCTPSRSQLMSGRYDIHTGLQHNVINAGQRNALPLDNILLPEQLRQCGYDTHMVGKWHLGFYARQFLPQYRGFNSYFGNLNGAGDYYTHSTCNWRYCGVDMRDTYGPSNATWGRYSTSVFTERAKKAITGRDESKPLFLYLAHKNVHYPMQAPKRYVEPFKYIKKKKRRRYAGMVAALDEAVKNVTDHLKFAGILNNTIIIFSSDNGGHTFYGGNNWPMRGRKGTLWEGGVKGVGFITGTPLRLSNITSNNFMHISDWFPTILSAAGCPTIRGTQPLDGFDQWEAILQKKRSPRTELLHNIDPLQWSPSRNPKIVNGFNIKTYAAIRLGSWKLLTGKQGFSKWVEPPEQKRRERSSGRSSPVVKKAVDVQLFHIRTDPYEQYEISVLYPTVVNHLLGRLAAYHSTAVPARYPRVDKMADPKYQGGFWGPWVGENASINADI